MGIRPWWLIALATCSAPPADRAAPPSIRASAPPPAADAAACRDGDPAAQRHGAPCLCCHSDEFGVGGSIDPSGGDVTRIVITDALGDVADLAPNPFHNFFRHFTMTPPLRAVVYSADGRAAAMREPAPSADCNGCHFPGGPAPSIHGP